MSRFSERRVGSFVGPVMSLRRCEPEGFVLGPKESDSRGWRRSKLYVGARLAVQPCASESFVNLVKCATSCGTFHRPAARGALEGQVGDASESSGGFEQAVEVALPDVVVYFELAQGGRGFDDAGDAGQVVHDAELEGEVAEGGERRGWIVIGTATQVGDRNGEALESVERVETFDGKRGRIVDLVGRCQGEGPQVG